MAKSFPQQMSSVIWKKISFAISTFVIVEEMASARFPNGKFHAWLLTKIDKFIKLCAPLPWGETLKVDSQNKSGRGFFKSPDKQQIW